MGQAVVRTKTQGGIVRRQGIGKTALGVPDSSTFEIVADERGRGTVRRFKADRCLELAQGRVKIAPLPKQLPKGAMNQRQVGAELNGRATFLPGVGKPLLPVEGPGENQMRLAFLWPQGPGLLEIGPGFGELSLPQPEPSAIVKDGIANRVAAIQVKSGGEIGLGVGERLLLHLGDAAQQVGPGESRPLTDAGRQPDLRFTWPAGV